MNNIFGTAPVPPEFWYLPMMFGVVLFCLDEIRKLILRQWALHKKSLKHIPLDSVTSSVQ